MKFTSKGIGWLIAGLIICYSATQPDDLAGTIGSFLLGLVFVVVYLMKQSFEPAGKGWFIAGGILTAFLVETTMETLAETFRGHPFDKDDLSTILIVLVIVCGCFYAFYRVNKYEIDETAAEFGIGDYYPTRILDAEDEDTEAEPDTGEEPEAAEPEQEEPEEIEFEFSAEDDKDGA